MTMTQPKAKAGQTLDLAVSRAEYSQVSTTCVSSHTREHPETLNAATALRSRRTGDGSKLPSTWQDVQHSRRRSPRLEPDNTIYGCDLNARRLRSRAQGREGPDKKVPEGGMDARPCQHSAQAQVQTNVIKHTTLGAGPISNHGCRGHQHRGYIGIFHPWALRGTISGPGKSQAYQVQLTSRCQNSGSKLKAQSPSPPRICVMRNPLGRLKSSNLQQQVCYPPCQAAAAAAAVSLMGLCTGQVKGVVTAACARLPLPPADCQAVCHGPVQPHLLHPGAYTSNLSACTHITAMTHD